MPSKRHRRYSCESVSSCSYAAPLRDVVPCSSSPSLFLPSRPRRVVRNHELRVTMREGRRFSRVASVRAKIKNYETRKKALWRNDFLAFYASFVHLTNLRLSVDDRASRPGKGGAPRLAPASDYR